MTAYEVMLALYPDLPAWKRKANEEWLAEKADMVKQGGLITSPRDGWVISPVGPDDYQIVFTNTEDRRN